MEFRKDIQLLQDEFKFVIEIEPADEKIMYLKFEDERSFRLQHPGALAVARLFNKDTKDTVQDCLEFFINKCIDPMADGKTKRLTSESLDIEETLNLWTPFAWRWLRSGYRIAA